MNASARTLPVVQLVPLQPVHAQRRLELVIANRDHLAPWEPVRSDAWFTRDGQVAWIAQQCAQRADGRALRWQVEVDGALLGEVSLSNIVRGSFHSTNLGYWVDAAHVGQGIATAAVGLAVRQAFGELGLHRIEAGTLLHNTASRSVLERNHFERIGIAPRYLNIADVWQDHLLFQRVNESWVARS